MSDKLKRAAEADDAAPQAPAKKRKRRNRKQEDDAHLDLENSVNLSVGLMDNQLLSDYFSRMVTRSKTDLTPVELADLSLSGEPLDLLLLTAAGPVQLSSIVMSHPPNFVIPLPVCSKLIQRHHLVGTQTDV